MRIAEREIHEKRIRVLRPLAQVRDRFIDDLAARFAGRTIGFIVLQILVDVEPSLNQRRGVSFFAVMIRDIASRFHRQWKIRPVARRDRAFVFRLIRRRESSPAKKRISGQQHVAAGRADGGRVTSETVRIPHHEPAPHQRVEMRCFGRTAKRAQRYRLHVVGKQEQHVRPRFVRRASGR